MAGRLQGAAASSPLPRVLLLLAALALFSLSFLSLRSLRPAAAPAVESRPILLHSSSSVYHSPEAFAAGYAEMERSFKVYIYPDGDPKTFYQTPRKLTGKYSSEGYFFQNIRESRFRTDDPDQAHIFFVPISPHKMRGKGTSYENMTMIVKDYVEGLINKYPYWNRTLGADHFFVTCHDVGVRAFEGLPFMVKNSIRVVCSPSYNVDFIPHKDIALPQVLQPFALPEGGNDIEDSSSLPDPLPSLAAAAPPPPHRRPPPHRSAGPPHSLHRHRRRRPPSPSPLELLRPTLTQPPSYPARPAPPASAAGHPATTAGPACLPGPPSKAGGGEEGPQTLTLNPAATNTGDSAASSPAAATASSPATARRESSSLVNGNRSMMTSSERCLHGTIAKKRKVQETSLCSLPMDILSTILSLLPINDAIRTSVLSRQLKYVWCSHSNLTFDKCTMRKTYFRPSTGGFGFLKDKEEFVRNVDSILQQHSGTGVKRMEIKFQLHCKHADHIDRWVNFAIASKTKEFVINLSGYGAKSVFFRGFRCLKWIVREEPYNLPSQLFSPTNGSCLRCLELWTVSLQLPSDFKGFLNLKSLTLVYVTITDEDVQCLLSKCNLLEFFEIAYCRMVTSIRSLHPLAQLKHLVVDTCPKIKEIELNCNLTTLKYTGALVPLIFASTSRLTNVSILFCTPQSALSYIITGFLSTHPRLETLTLLCCEYERTIVPERPLEFTYLRHLRLELILFDEQIRKTDVLDYGHLLKIAPFMETLELPMWRKFQHRPYSKDDGELRPGLPHQHAHLKSVRISGFFGHKDQVELALHILRSSIVLEKMEITPKLEMSNNLALLDSFYYEKKHYLDGHRVATEFVCKADRRNVVRLCAADHIKGLPIV